MSEAILPVQARAQTSHQEKEWSPAKVIYMILMALALLSHIWLMVIGAGIDNIPTYIWIIRLLTVPFAFCLGKLWKDKGFQILCLYFLLFFFRCFIPNPGSVFSVEVAESILGALWLFAGCYGMARALTVNQFKRFLSICSIVWIAGISILAGIGIYTAWTDQIIKLSNEAIIQASEGRLKLVYEATTSGAILSMTLLVGIVYACCTKQRICRAFVFLVLLPIILAIALTDSRTAYISVATGISAMIIITIIRHFVNKAAIPEEIHKRILFIACIIIALLVLIVAFVIAFMHITPVFNYLKIRGLIPKALAEGTEKTIIESRGFDGSRVLSGRDNLWRWIYEYIVRNPIMLLKGKTKIFPLGYIAGWYGHCHNILLQVLVESGIPGLMLILMFAWRTVIRSMFVITKPGVSLKVCLLPAILLSLFVADMGECFIWLRASYIPVSATMFIFAGTICTQSPRGNKSTSLQHSFKGAVLP